MWWIFIGASSGVGKTGITNSLLSKLNTAGIQTQKLNMDDYYHERPDDREINEFRENTNFDVPEMLDLERLKNDVQTLSKGQSIIKRKFAFHSNKYEGEETIDPSECIIVEGIFAQLFYQEYFPEDIPALNININTESYLDIIKRRIKRDQERGLTEARVIQKEHRDVGPGFFKFTARFASGSDLYVSNNYHSHLDEQAKQLDAIVEDIKANVQTKKTELSHGSGHFERAKRPDARKLVAQSYIKQGLCVNHKFNAFFPGIFGEPEGFYEYEEEYSPKVR